MIDDLLHQPPKNGNNVHILVAMSILKKKCSSLIDSCHIQYIIVCVLDPDICLKSLICVLFILRFTFLEDGSNGEKEDISHNTR